MTGDGGSAAEIEMDKSEPIHFNQWRLRWRSWCGTTAVKTSCQEAGFEASEVGLKASDVKDTTVMADSANINAMTTIYRNSRRGIPVDDDSVNSGSEG